MYILFPSSYFNKNNVDEDLQNEYDAAITTGLFDAILFSYDKWFNENRLDLSLAPPQTTKAIYRGWMMKPEQYKAFYENLIANNIQLLTTPDEYKLFHIFPNIYPQLKADTAKMLIFDADKIDLDKVRKTFKRFMVKDFVKSVKGTDFPKYFENTVSDDEFKKQMEIFFKYRGELYTGGICVKEYLELKKYDSKTNEYRVFYLNNIPITVSCNSLQPNYAPKPPQELIQKYSSLGSPFYTIDFAELQNGEWKIIETGDGQVSGLSEGQNYEAFFRALLIRTKLY